MNKNDKIIIIFYVFLAVSFLVTINYVSINLGGPLAGRIFEIYRLDPDGYYVGMTDSEGHYLGVQHFSSLQLSEATSAGVKIYDPKNIREPQFTTSVEQPDEITITNMTDVNKTVLFDVMTDLQNYPPVLPSIVSVTIMNQSSYVTYAKVNALILAANLKSHFLVKQIIVPDKEQSLEIIGGDANGTTLIQEFENNGSKSMVTTHLKLQLNGMMFPLFIMYDKLSMQESLVGVTNSYLDFAKEYGDSYEKIGSKNREIVYDIYNEILHRRADPSGIIYYGSQLESGQMTIADIKDALYNSNEGRALETSSMKPGELDPKIQKTIDDIYNEILHRHADPSGMLYYGSQLESGQMTIADIRKTISESDEAASLRIHSYTDHELDDLYEEILHRHVDQQALDYYGPLLKSGNMTLDEVKKELELTK